MSKKTTSKDTPISWYVDDGGVRMSDCRKELAVCSVGAVMNWQHIIEETHYTGQFTKNGKRLAARLCKLLNEIAVHEAVHSKP